MTDICEHTLTAVLPGADDDDCSLNDVHRVLRESHKSHGLSSSSKFVRSFHMSVDLTSKLADSAHPEDDENSMDLSVARRVNRAIRGGGSSVGPRRKRSLSSDDQSAAPSVVGRSTTLASAFASADCMLSNLEDFLHGDASRSDGDDACSLQSELRRLRNSEKKLNGLWVSSTPDDDDQSLSSWRMMGDEPSVMTEDYDESSVMVGSIMGSVMLGSIMENYDEERSYQELNPDEDVEDVDVQSHNDDLSVLSMGEAQDLVREDTTHHADKSGQSATTPLSPNRVPSSPTPPLKRLSLLSNASWSSGVMKELNDLYDEEESLSESPIGFVSFDSPPKQSVEQPLDSPSFTAPTLQSYQDSTEDGDEIFYNADAELNDDEDILCGLENQNLTIGLSGVPALISTSECSARSVAAVTVPWKRSAQKSSIVFVFDCVEKLAEVLYGW